MRTACTWSVVALGMTVAPGLRADLRVNVPPGAPLEWVSELPGPAFDENVGPLGPRYTAGGRDAEPEASQQPRTSVARPPRVEVRRPLRAAPPVGSFNPMSRARITTLDIVAHEDWTQFRGDGGARDYPPSLDVGLHWFAVATFLMPAYYPSRCSVSETAQALITLGPPVLEVLPPAGWGRGRSAKLIAYLQKNIPAVPEAAPDLDEVLDESGDGAEERMLTRWAAGALVADHFLTLDPAYCRYLRLLGSDAIAPVLACSRSFHVFLGQNAIGFLAGTSALSDPRQERSVRERLLEALGESDGVARNRAFEGLVLRGAPEVESVLVASLDGDDLLFRPYAMRLLARLGGANVRDVILDAVKRASSKDRGELWLAATHALAGVPDADSASRRALARLVRLIGRRPRVFDVPPEHMVDDPDQPGDRARILAQAIRLTLAILGDRKQRDYVSPALLGDGKPREPFRLSAGEGSLPLARISPHNRLLAVSLVAILAGQDDEMEKLLQDIISSEADLLLRRYALRAYAETRLGDATIAEVADDESAATPLRLDALELLVSSSQRRHALSVARDMVRRYVAPLDESPSSTDAHGPISRADECVTALRLLASLDALNARAIRRVVKIATERKDFARLERTRGRRRAVPPVLETAVLVAESLDASVAVPLLVEVLRGSSPARFEAALVLGTFPRADVAELLVETLGDAEPWVRYGAYRALRGISGERHFADWLFGKAGERASAHEAWAAWLDRAKLQQPRDRAKAARGDG